MNIFTEIGRMASPEAVPARAAQRSRILASSLSGKVERQIGRHAEITQYLGAGGTVRATVGASLE